jgi:hypothetical protein
MAARYLTCSIQDKSSRQSLTSHAVDWEAPGWARELSQASLPWQRHCSALSIQAEASCGFLGKCTHTPVKTGWSLLIVVGTLGCVYCCRRRRVSEGVAFFGLHQLDSYRYAKIVSLTHLVPCLRELLLQSLEHLIESTCSTICMTLRPLFPFALWIS